MDYCLENQNSLLKSNSISCRNCNSIISSKLIQFQPIIHCLYCPNATYCSLKCRDIDTNNHDKECSYNWDWFWNHTITTFSSNYMLDRQFKCSVWNLLCMMSCQNDLQRSVVYRELCCLQPVHPKFIAQLLEEDERVQENITIPMKNYQQATKIINHWFQEHSILPKSSTPNLNSHLKSNLNLIEDRINGIPKFFNLQERLDLKNIAPTFSFYNADKWFISPNDKDITGESLDQWEKRDWKILGANIYHLQIGQWITERSFEYQFRLRVNIDMKSLEYHIFNHKSKDWKFIDEILKKKLIGKSRMDDLSKCSFFSQELDQFIHNSRHVVIYIPIEYISTMRAHRTKVEHMGQYSSLFLTLHIPPLFFEEISLNIESSQLFHNQNTQNTQYIHPNYQHNSHWIETNDFTTNACASKYSKHFLLLENSELDKLIPLIIELAGQNALLTKSFSNKKVSDAIGELKSSNSSKLESSFFKLFEEVATDQNKQLIKRLPIEFLRNPEV